jgi:Na+-transporting NADH:ubiquinone oxidoreductase subunit C
MNKTSPGYVLGFMLLVCLCFGFAVSLVHYSTQDMLKKNETLQRNRTICRAFMLDVPEKTAEGYGKAVELHIEENTVEEGERTWYIFTRRDIENSDIGFLFQGMGLWDEITGVLVISPDLGEIVNIEFLFQRETPGLGARIEEQWFREQFRGVSIAWENPLEERLIVGSTADPDAENRIDAITGATQTSLALEKILNSELESFRHIHQRHILSGLGAIPIRKTVCLHFLATVRDSHGRNTIVDIS